MKKRIKLLLVSLLVIFVGILAFNSSSNKKSEAAISGFYSGDLEAVVTSEFEVDATGSNAVTSVIPGGTYYISWYYFVNSGITGFVNKYRIPQNMVSSIDFILYEDMTSAELRNTYFDGDRDSCGDFQDFGDYIYGRQGTQTGKHASSSKGFASNASVINTLATEYELILNYSTSNGVSSAAGDKVLIGKAKVVLSSTATSLLLTNTEFQMAGRDNISGKNVWTSAANPGAMTDISVGGGSASDSVVLNPATVIGNNTGATASNLSINGTAVSGSVDVSATTATFNLGVEDSGTVNSVVLNSVTKTSAPFTFDVSGLAAGSSYTGTIKVTAQDGTTDETYTLTLTKDKYDIATLSSLTFSSPTGTTYVPTLNTTFASGTKNYTLTVPSTCTGFKMTPTVTPNVSIAGLKINTASATSGSAYTFTSVPNAIAIEVEAQDGTKETYNITISTYTVDTQIGTVEVYNAANNAKLGNANVDNTNHTISYSGVVFSVSSVYFKITASNATQNSMKFGTGNPPTATYTSGSSSSSVSFISNAATAYVSLTDNKTSDSQVYSISVSQTPASSINTVSAVGFAVTNNAGGSMSGTLSGSTYTIATANGMPYNDTSFKVFITPDDTNATVTINGNPQGSSPMNIPFTSEPTIVTIQVTAQDGSTPNIYTISVPKGPANSTNTVASTNGIIVKNPAGNTLPGSLTGTTYNATTNHLAFTDNSVTVTLTLTDSTYSTWRFQGETVYYNSGQSQPYTFDSVGTKKGGTFTINILVKAQDGTEKPYVINIERDGASSINTVGAGGFSVTNNAGNPMSGTLSGSTYTIATANGMPYNDTSFKVFITPDDTNATVTINGNPQGSSPMSIPFTSDPTIVTIQVTAQDGSTPNIYTISVPKGPANSTNTVASTNGIIVKNPAGNTLSGSLSGTTYNATANHLSFTDNSVTVTLTLTDSTYSTWRFQGETVYYISGQTQTYTFDSVGTKNAGTFAINVLVKAQDGTEKPYTINIERDGASSDSSIDTGNLEIKTSDGTVLNYTYDAATKKFTITDDVPYKCNSLIITANVTDSHYQQFTIGGLNAIPGDPKTVTIGSSTDLLAVNINIPIYVKAQNDTSSTYTIVGKRAAAETDNAVATNGLVIVDSKGTTRPTSLSGNTYTIIDTLPYSVTGFDITITLNGTKSKLTINNVSKDSGSAYSYSIPSSTSALSNQSVPFVITSESGVANPFTIVYNRAAASPDNSLQEVTLSMLGDDGNTYTATYNSSTKKYVLDNDIPYTVNKLTVTVNTTSSLATLKIASNPATSGVPTDVEIGTASDIAITPINIKISVTSESNLPQDYYITGNREAADGHNDLTATVYGNTSGDTYSQGVSTTNTDELNYSIQTVGKSDTQVRILLSTSHNLTTTITVKDSLNGDQVAYNPAKLYTVGTTTVAQKYYVVVTPENGMPKQYTINLYAADERDPNHDLTDLYVADSTGKISTWTYDDTKSSTYSISVPYNKTSVSVVWVKASSSSDVYTSSTKTTQGISSINVATITPGSTVSYTYMCFAANDTHGYLQTINITRENGNSDAYVTNLKINGQAVPSFNQTDRGPYTIVLNRGITNVNISYETKATNSTVTLNTPVMTGGKATATVSVQSEDGNNSIIYTVNVYSANQDYSINNIQVLDYDESVISTDASGNETFAIAIDQEDINGNTYSFAASTATSETINITVPYSVDKVFIYVQAGNAYSTVVGNGTFNLTNTGASVNTRNVQVTSEYGMLNTTATGTKSTIYKFRITREAPDSENKLATFTPTIDGVAVQTADLVFSPSSSNIAISNVDSSATTLTVVVTKVSNKSKVSIDGDTTGALTKNVDITALTSSASVTFNIIVTSEAGVPNPYRVTVSRETIVLDDNKTINSILITGSNSQDYSPNITTSTGPFDINVPATLASVSVAVSLGSNKATCTIEVEDILGNVTSSQGITRNISLGTGTTKVTVYATSESGIEGAHYVINLIKPEASGTNTLDSMTIDGTIYANPTSPLNVYLPYGTTQTTITAVKTDPKSTLTLPNGDGIITGLTTGLNTVTVLVVSESGVSNPYVVSIWVDEEAKLGDLSVEGQTMTPVFNPTTYSYTVEVEYNINSVNIKYLLPTGVDSSLLKVTGTGVQTLNSNLETFVVRVAPLSQTAIAATPSGIYQDYTIVVNRKTASTGAELLSVDYILDTASGPVTLTNVSDTTPVTIDASRITSSIQFDNIVVSDGATYTVNNNAALINGISNTKTITVTSQSGSSKTYTFKIVCADKSFDIVDIALESTSGDTIKDVDGNQLIFANGPVYQLTVANSINALNILISKPSYATVYINGVALPKGTSVAEQLNRLSDTNVNTFVIYAVSEYGEATSTPTGNKSQEYTIEITRKVLSTNATLQSLSVMIDGVEKILNFDPTDDGPYTITDIGDSALSAVILGVPADSTATVISGNGNLDLSNAATNTYTFNHKVIVQAEDGSTKCEYEIIISRGPLNVDDDNTLVGIDLFDSNGNIYIDSDDPLNNPNTDPYNFTIPAGVASFTISGSKLVSSTAVVNVRDVTNNGASTERLLQVVCDSSNWNTTIQYEVYAKSQSGIAGLKYTINVTIEAPSKDNTLTSLTVDGVLVTGFDPDFEGPYVVTKDSSIQNVTIAAVAGDSKSTITGDTGVQVLSEGTNIFVVTVTAQDGSKKSYKIQVNKAYAAPKLLTLGVNGEVLLDSTGLKTTFDPEVFEYNVNVVFYHETADIFASSSVATDKINGAEIKTLYVGNNKFVVTVTNIHGVSTEYTLNIRRLSAETTNSTAASAYITEIPAFETEFNPLQTSGYEYKVANKISSLNVVFTPENNGTNGEASATVQYIGNDYLYVGANNIVVIVTAADKSTTTTYVIRVTRSALNFEVDKEAYEEYTVTEGKDELTYNVSVGKKSSDDIDFVKYIKDLSPENQNLQVEVLTDTTHNPKEVLVRVTDGEQSSIVKFVVDSTLDDGSISIQDLLPLFICLGVVLIILIAILVSVNRDKYGRIVKKTRKQHEKEEKAEAKK